MSFSWGKTLTAVVTPLGTEGKVDYELAAKLCRDIVDNGCDGVVVCGTTGESATLTIQEKLELFTRVKALLPNKGIVVAGVGSNSTKETVDLIARVEEIPVDAYMVITPYYNKPNLAGLREHFLAVNAASSRPIMLYNVPSRTGLDMSLEAYHSVLAACPKITAVKEASPDMDKASQLVAELKEIDFYSGNDSLTLPTMALGFKGVVSVAANVVPGAMAELTNHIYVGEWEEARLVHQELFPLFKALFVETNPIPVKAALEIQGWQVGLPRLPLGNISPGNRTMLKTLLSRYRRERR